MCFIFDSVILFIDEIKKSIKIEDLNSAFISSELYFANYDLAIYLIPEAVNSEENIHTKKTK
jgi:hypothetical protein